MIKLLIALLIIACIAPFFIKGPDGEPIMTIDDWKIELPASVDELLKRPEPELPAAEQKLPTTVYKWQDEDGQWHFANTPPDMETAETMELSDINIMDAYQPPPAQGQVAQAESIAQVPSGVTTASPAQIKEMMETVTNLQETADQRKADMDRITGFED